MTSQKSQSKRTPVFDRTYLLRQIKTLQKETFDLERPSSLLGVGIHEAESLKVLPAFDWKAPKLSDYPALKRTVEFDPDEIGTEERPGFDDDDHLIRRPIRLDEKKRFITISLARRLSLLKQSQWHKLPLDSSHQLANHVQQARLRFIAELAVARSRELRRQGCLQFPDVKSYCANLYCRPPETTMIGGAYETCGQTRLCPWCWVRAYVTRVFFGLRAPMLDRMPNHFQRHQLRRDYKVITVRQCWTRPSDTHPFDLINELSARREELYRETPSQRSIKAMAQLQFIEPPMKAKDPWRLHRRAILVCNLTQPHFGYPHNNYDVQNDSWIAAMLTMRRLATLVGRTFDYPMAMQLAPTHLVRRLLDAYKLWPHDSRSGFRLLTTRGCLRRQARHVKDNPYD